MDRGPLPHTPRLRRVSVARGPIKRQTLGVLSRRGVPVQTVIDVGVLSGTPELMEAYPDCLHLLFEPVQEFAQGIERAYRNIPHKLVQVAVSDHSGTTPLHTTTVIAEHTISHSYMTTDQTQASRVVPMTTLDDYFRDNYAASPYLLKIDIDGLEMKVLLGSKETIRHCSIVIVEAYVDSLAEKIEFITRCGFKLFDLTEPCYYDEGFWQCDAVFLRSDLHRKLFLSYEDGFDFAKYTVFMAL
jgi:FkbM family methyltransferase